jgi:hypothetical protein
MKPPKDPPGSPSPHKCCPRSVPVCLCRHLAMFAHCHRHQYVCSDACAFPSRNTRDYVPKTTLPSALLSAATDQSLVRVFTQATVKNLIGGKFSESKTKKWIEVRNPVRSHAGSSPWKLEEFNRCLCGELLVFCVFLRRRPMKSLPCVLNLPLKRFVHGFPSHVLVVTVSALDFARFLADERCGCGSSRGVPRMGIQVRVESHAHHDEICGTMAWA